MKWNEYDYHKYMINKIVYHISKNKYIQILNIELLSIKICKN